MAKVIKVEDKEIKEVVEPTKVDVSMLLLKRIEELEAKLAKESVTKEVVKETPKVTKRSPLRNKIVIIEPINKGTSSVVPHDSAQATMLRGTNRSIICPIDSLGRLVNPLEDWEREYLEEKTGLNLDSYSPECFYATRKSVIKFKRRGIALDSASVALDLNDPFQYILYKIALASPEVANKWADRSNILYNYVIRDNNAQLAEDTAHSDKEDEVIGHLLSIKTNKKELFNLLRLYGNEDTLPVKVSVDRSVEWLYNEIRKVSKTRPGVRILYTIITTNKKAPERMNTMITLEDAVTCGALIKIGRKYMKEGGDIIGIDMTEACVYLEDVENQTFKMLVEAKITKYFKDR